MASHLSPQAHTARALYQTHRPHSFADVRNQEHIIRVLEGAVAKRTIPHALLFTGPRGTGKTTVARIFARAIGTDQVDTYEIDAASNRGIDDVRALREAVHALPYQSSYKVYIIDEVHMLTKEAFNALLKTLEEPPPHVVFILATTEADKLLDTILSRCQVFSFRAPARGAIRELVHDVAKKEQYTIADDAVDLIAVAADGSFRDALGVLQKVMTASRDTTIDTDEVAAIISAPKAALVAACIEALSRNNATAALNAVAQAAKEHVDIQLFTTLLLERVRTVILLRYHAASKATLNGAYTKEEQEALCTYADEKESGINSHLLRALLEVASSPLRTSLPQVQLELAIAQHIKKET